MKLAKSLFLGSVAALATVAGAQAADLPAKKAAPVEYVRVCNTYGAGFFYIPGTETCLRVGGRVRADYLYNTPLTRNADATGFRARGRIQLDARTATAYGLLRTFVRFEITRSSGTPFNGFNGNSATAPVNPIAGTIATSPNVAEAFVQFGGLTAGRVTSFFSNSDLPNQQMGTLRFDDAPDVDLLAYTFTFGNGFSASISIEDSLERRNTGFIAGGVDSTAIVYAGARMPDIVGNVKYTGTWGSAQLSGAVHQIRSAILNNAAFVPAGLNGTIPSNDYGFAVAGSVSVNLPQLAPGDALWLVGTYANGALAYLSGGNANLSSSPFNLIGVNPALTFADAWVSPSTGDIKTASGWAVAGGLRHFWTPQIRQNVFGSYLSVNYGKGASSVITAGNFAGTRTGLDSFTEWRVGTNVFWQPVAGLDLGVEVLYARLDPRGRVLVNHGSVPAAAGNLKSTGGEGAWEGRVRVQRDF